MLVYEIYVRRKNCNAVDQGDLIGTLPESRQQSTLESVESWAKKVFGSFISEDQYLYVLPVQR